MNAPDPSHTFAVAVAWALGVVIALLILRVLYHELPSMRRYLRIKRM
jgi:hypothetical protein